MGAPHVGGRCLGYRHVEEHLHQVDEGDLLAAQPASDGAHGAELGQQPVATRPPRRHRPPAARPLPRGAPPPRRAAPPAAPAPPPRSPRAAAGRQARNRCTRAGAGRSAAPGPGSAPDLVHAAILPAGPLTRLDPHRYRPGTASNCGRNTQAKGAKPMTLSSRAPSSARGPNPALTGPGSASGSRRARSTRPFEQPPSGDAPLTVFLPARPSPRQPPWPARSCVPQWLLLRVDR